MTRSELLSKLARALNKNGSGAVSNTLDTATETRLLDHLNNRHREILSWPGSERLRYRTLTFASVASQARYGLPNVEDVLEIRETTNDRTLIRRSLHEYRRMNPDPAAMTGVPEAWVPLGYQAVALFPTSGPEELYAKSTSASDTQTVYVEGTLRHGYPIVKSATLTGTTAVALSAVQAGGSNIHNVWVSIDKFYLSTAAVGMVTLHETSGSGTEIGRIIEGQTRQQYYGLELDPTPSAALTYNVDAILAISDLAQTTDEPLLPRDFHDALFWGAMVDELIKTDDQRLVVAEARWRERTSALQLRLARMTLDQGPSAGWSRLGAWTPAGS